MTTRVIKLIGKMRHRINDSGVVNLVLFPLLRLLSSVLIHDSSLRIFGRAIIAPSIIQNTVRSAILPIPTNCSIARLIMVAIMPIRTMRYSIDKTGDLLLSSSNEETNIDMNNSNADNNPRTPCSNS